MRWSQFRVTWCAALVAATTISAFAPPLLAQSADGMFRDGVEAVREGEYERAVERFEAAHAAGLDTGALHFNLGVAHYRAGDSRAAELAFQRAVETGSMVAPAYYQLARIARERGHFAQARERFRRATEEAKTEALRSRAQAGLAALVRADTPEYVYLSAGGGYDSNLSLTPSDASGASENSDTFFEGTLVVRRPVESRNYLRGSVYLQQFFAEDDFDLVSAAAGFGRVGGVGTWRWDMHVDARHQRFGGDAFENALIATGELSRHLPADWSLGVGYQLARTSGASGFDFLDGWTHRFDAVVDQRGSRGWRINGWLERVDREDRETADDFLSFSWTAVGMDGRYGFQLAGTRRLAFRVDGVHRTYEGAEIRNDARLAEREDDLLGAEARLTQDIAHQWRLEASLRSEQRDSNLDEFDYDRAVIRAGLERVF